MKAYILSPLLGASGDESGRMERDRSELGQRIHFFVCARCIHIACYSHVGATTSQGARVMIQQAIESPRDMPSPVAAVTPAPVKPSPPSIPGAGHFASLSPRDNQPNDENSSRKHLRALTVASSQHEQHPKRAALNDISNQIFPFGSITTQPPSRNTATVRVYRATVAANAQQAKVERLQYRVNELEIEKAQRMAENAIVDAFFI
jgi:hypothetical protein